MNSHSYKTLNSMLFDISLDAVDYLIYVKSILHN